MKDIHKRIIHPQCTNIRAVMQADITIVVMIKPHKRMLNHLVNPKKKENDQNDEFLMMDYFFHIASFLSAFIKRTKIFNPLLSYSMEKIQALTTRWSISVLTGLCA